MAAIIPEISSVNLLHDSNFEGATVPTYMNFFTFPKYSLIIFISRDTNAPAVSLPRVHFQITGFTRVERLLYIYCT